MSLLLISGALLFNTPTDPGVMLVRFPGGTVLEAEVAETPEKLLFGLAFRDELPDGHGLLFLFEQSGLHRVWTKEYRFNVDMMWINESKHIVHIVETAVPCEIDPCERHGPPPERARYVLMANGGFVDRAAVSVGQELVFALRM